MNTKSTHDSLRFGYYLVAFIDVLNQREALREFKELPKTEQEKNDFIKAAKNTFGVIDGIRGLFDEFFAQYQDQQAPDSNSPQDFRALLMKIRGTKVSSQRFMDTIIIYLALADSEESLPMSGIYSALLACGSTFLYSLAAKHALRGSIEVGLGAELHPGDIYGPVVYEAYRLESTVAKYPRIVIGQQLLNYLFGKKSAVDSNLYAKFTAQMADTCLRFMTQDIDGHAILDYLGRDFVERGENLLLKQGIHTEAFAFVNQQLARWKQEKNTELAFRYSLLQKYFDARLAMWEKIKADSPTFSKSS